MQSLVWDAEHLSKLKILVLLELWCSYALNLGFNIFEDSFLLIKVDHLNNSIFWDSKEVVENNDFRNFMGTKRSIKISALSSWSSRRMNRIREMYWIDWIEEELQYHIQNWRASDLFRVDLFIEI